MKSGKYVLNINGVFDEFGRVKNIDQALKNSSEEYISYPVGNHNTIANDNDKTIARVLFEKDADKKIVSGRLQLTSDISDAEAKELINSLLENYGTTFGLSEDKEPELQ